MSEIDKVNENLEKLTATIVETRDKIKELETAQRGTGEKLEEHRRISEDLATEVAKQQDVDALKIEIDNIEARFDRMKIGEEKSGVQSEEYRCAILDLLMHDSISECGDTTRNFFRSPEYRTFSKPYEKRALNETSDSAGGFFVTPEMDATVLRNVTQVDPMRSIARVQPVGSDSIEIPKATSGNTAYWPAEGSASTESTSATGMWDIKIHGLGVLTNATRSWLMDTFINAEQWISEEAGIAMGYAEGVAFVTGSGVGQPLGFMTGHGTDNDIYPADVTGGGTAVLEADDFSELIGALKAEYWNGSRFVMNQNTLVDTIQLKESTSGAYIWQPALAGGFPSTILGLPFTILPTMSDQSDGSYPVAIGNFTRGYRIFDRMGTLLVKDPAGSFPNIVYNFLRRVGGRVVVPEAIKVLLVT